MSDLLPLIVVAAMAAAFALGALFHRLGWGGHTCRDCGHPVDKCGDLCGPCLTAALRVAFARTHGHERNRP
jgi:hypothetical protein